MSCYSAYDGNKPGNALQVSLFSNCFSWPCSLTTCSLHVIVPFANFAGVIKRHGQVILEFILNFVSVLGYRCENVMSPWLLASGLREMYILPWEKASGIVMRNIKIPNQLAKQHSQVYKKDYESTRDLLLREPARKPIPKPEQSHNTLSSDHFHVTVFLLPQTVIWKRINEKPKLSFSLCHSSPGWFCQPTFVGIRFSWCEEANWLSFLLTQGSKAVPPKDNSFHLPEDDKSHALEMLISIQSLQQNQLNWLT